MQSSKAEALPILVVDDDSALIRTLSDILRMRGYSPETAETGSEGLRKAGDRPPALAVIDLRLPDMDGMELVSRLHELSEMTEVVVLTGNASVESAIAALREHSVDYLLKPVHVEQLLQVVSVATERWQRKLAERALRVSEERYRMLFDANPQPVWVFDRETLRFLAVNDAAMRHYGYSREEFLGMSVVDIRPAEDRALYRKVAGQQPPFVDRPWRHLTKTGVVMDVSIRTHDIDFAGRPARIVLAVDITEQVAAQSAAAARVRQQGALASFGQRALVASDMTALFQDAVAVVAGTLDTPYAGVFERRARSEPALRAAVGFEGAALGRSEEVLRLEAGIASGLSAEIPGPVAPFGILGAYDVADRRFSRDDIYFLQAVAQVVGTSVQRATTEMGLRQSQRMEAVGQLAGGVAHDFNNMLTAITGYGELLRAELEKGTPARDDVEEILKAAARAAGLTRQLLAFSRQQVLQPRLVNLSDIVAGMQGMLRRLIGEDIEFVTVLARDLGFVKADSGQIEQVILNLCVNARDAMPGGGTLTVETADGELDMSRTSEQSVASPGGYVMLAVSDTGTGMDEHTLERIYEPFFTTKAADKGTGLGLATVYGIVKQSGGEIFVTSELGVGTTFKVYLPLSSIADVAPDSPAASDGAAHRSGAP